MNVADVDLAIARTEGRQAALREIRELVAPAPAPPAAPVPPASTAAGRCDDRPVAGVAGERQQTERVERAQRLNGHAGRVAVEEPPAEKAVRMNVEERRRQLAKLLLRHGPTSRSELLKLAGLKGAAGLDAALQHEWFERDEHTYQWSLTTAGHQAARGVGEDE
jgi:hypothetical protein